VATPPRPAPDDDGVTLLDTAASGVLGPQLFGKYYLLDRLAVGGMAEIFRARTFGEGGFENQLVIKRILAHLSENDAFVRMFMDEAKITVQLQHANIVRIYDFGRIRDNYFIAMEYVDGKDVKLLLRKLSERRKLLPREYAAFIAMEAAKGLDVAHKRAGIDGTPLHVVHRDVSPSNVLVSYQGEVKVADFGIVKAATVVETTEAGTLKGKFEYMSPEQARGRELDRRSDIFSLGIILHEMLTGRRLFKSDNDLRTLERIKAGDIPRPSALHAHVPPRLDQIVMRALSMDPDARYQEARDMAADLLEFLYPVPPDVTQQSLAAFLGEVFSEEIADERARLEDGIRRARAMHDAADVLELEPDDDEDAHTAARTDRHGTNPRGVPPAARRETPVAALVVGGIGLAGALGLTAWLANAPASPTSSPERRAREAQPVTGTLLVRVAPGNARVLLDGTPIGAGPEVAIPDLAAGEEHTVRVEADGYAPHDEVVAVGAGERVVIRATLTPAP
jgi:predicted Ser/Thr protein kinase